MKQQLTVRRIISYKELFLLLAGVYLFINFTTFFWNVIEVEGFWSVIFYVVALALTGMFIFNIWEVVDEFIHAKKTKRSLVEVFKLFIASIVYAALFYGSVFFISKNMMDRYKLIHRSEEYFKMGQFDLAIDFAKAAYKKANTTETKSHPFFILQRMYEGSRYDERIKQNKKYQSIINLAYCYQAKGMDLESSENLYQDALGLSKTVFKDYPEYQYFPLIGLFRIYIAEGKIQQSDQIYKELSEAFKNLTYIDKSYKAKSFAAYALFAERNNDIKKAKQLRKEALEIMASTTHTSNTLEYANLLLEASLDAMYEGDMDNARVKLELCRELFKKRKNSYLYPKYLQNYSYYCELTGDLENAEEGLRVAYKKVTETPGTSPLSIVNAEYLLGNFYFRREQFTEAIKFYDQSLEHIQGIKSSNEMLYKELLLGSALCDVMNGNNDKAQHKADLIEDQMYDLFNERFILLPERERELYVEANERHLSLLNWIRISDQGSKNTEKIYNNILATKAIALDVNRNIRNILSDKSMNFHQEAYNLLLQKKESIEKRKLEGVENPEVFFAIEDSIRTAEVEFLKEISTNTYFRQFKINSSDWEQIKGGLGEGEVAVEFMHIPKSPLDIQKQVYYALLIKQGLKEPQLLELFEDSKITDLIGSGDNFAMTINELYAGENLKRLYDLVWRPLEGHIGGASKVYISLAGILHQISIPILTMDEKYSVKILSSTRSLLADGYHSTTKDYRKAVLFGDIDYSKTSENGNELQDQKSSLQDYVDRSGFKALGGTLEELHKISTILESEGIETKKYMKEKATEYTFKNINKLNPAILHVATHGFYYSSERSFQLSELYGFRHQRDKILNPLFRSALLFAGANNGRPDKDGEDGILTSYEVSKIDLSEVDLVVLSACETGLGEIRGGEGVFGLQRAFTMAGVNSLIISLWKVPDKETSELMSEFYRYFMIEKYEKQAALKEAQRHMRKKYPTQPIYWGAFMLLEQ